MLVQNGKPRYKSSIVRGFGLTGAKLVAGKIAKTLINVHDGLFALAQICKNIWSEFLTYVRF